MWCLPTHHPIAADCAIRDDRERAPFLSLVLTACSKPTDKLVWENRTRGGYGHGQEKKCSGGRAIGQADVRGSRSERALAGHAMACHGQETVQCCYARLGSIRIWMFGRLPAVIGSAALNRGAPGALEGGMTWREGVVGTWLVWGNRLVGLAMGRFV
ncbi:hypothetical protein BS50DRAFT_74828 [Corynespora cassiicola Philippines]|uniref:Uncharacterized protein n=1 Tax=Corynespora cassiicola Philippines TaxID=1448308 RepID=A0A2T2NGA7_CORCC|nr:hypothetical protein BS50DRAFT_74828 [Corynespora cassiicola Philippines]